MVGWQGLKFFGCVKDYFLLENLIYYIWYILYMVSVIMNKEYYEAYGLTKKYVDKLKKKERDIIWNKIYDFEQGILEYEKDRIALERDKEKVEHAKAIVDYKKHVVTCATVLCGFILLLLFLLG